MGNVAGAGMNQPDLDVAARDVVRRIYQVELIRLLCGRRGQILRRRRDICPSRERIVPLLNLDVVGRVAAVMSHDVKVNVVTWNVVILAKGEVVDERVAWVVDLG